MAAIASTPAQAEIIAASRGARAARGDAPAIEIEIDRPVGTAVDRVPFVGEVRERKSRVAPDHGGRRVLIQHAEAGGRTVKWLGLHIVLLNFRDEGRSQSLAGRRVAARRVHTNRLVMTWWVAAARRPAASGMRSY